jgi:Fe-S-cluster containining protein
MEALARLFARMDTDYLRAARAYGFVCAGCDDNCCRSRFYHHTLVEYLYLRQGLKCLPDAQRARVEARAAQAVARMAAVGEGAPSDAVMCPLNEEGQCILYAHRPMICRLHGIPHQLQRPDGRRQVGPGCGDFDRQCGASSQPILDRTPLYAALADLERELRRRLGVHGKIKMAIAQMVVEALDLPNGEDARHEVY